MTVRDDLRVVLCRWLNLSSNALNSLPPGVFDKNTALEYDSCPRPACLALAEGDEAGFRDLDCLRGQDSTFVGFAIRTQHFLF
jgi:hypothetical protein